MTTQSPTQRAHTEPTETGCAASEPTPSWREYMALNPDWQTARTPNVYAAGYYAGMRHPRLPVATASGVVPTVPETGAFLVTSPSIEEALAALDGLRLTFASDGSPAAIAFDSVRSALTSAAQEAAAWREIEAWLQADRTRDACLLPMTHAQSWRFVVDDVKMIARHFAGPTRLAAIVAAGEYCRAENSK